MAFLTQQMTYPIRSSNKEPDWATVYDDLFNQYIDIDDFDVKDPTLGGFNTDDLNNKASELFEPVSDSCEGGSSPQQNIGPKEIEADYWARTLRSLETSAAVIEQRGREQLRSHNHRDAKVSIHPDFLSLGGHPSPRIPSPPISPSEAARRRKGQIDNARSKSAGRAPGIRKQHCSGSKSPKMMNPSRYRAGFKDVWEQKTSGSPQMYALKLPVRPAPMSPPPSVKINHVVDSAAFCSPREIDTAPTQHVSFLHEQHSPYPQHIQYHPQTTPPYSSPLTTPGVERGDVFGDSSADVLRDPFDQRSMYYALPPTTPRSWSSRWNAGPVPDEEDNYEVSTSFNPWCETGSKGHHQFSPRIYAGFDDTEADDYDDRDDDLATSGLMILCDPFKNMYSEKTTDLELSALPKTPYFTPGEQHSYRFASRSPSPSPQRGRTLSKQRNRRTPSTPRSPRRVSKSAFVNLTPHDSAKLLTGVAPSGSSKTKARREREANDKRRKLSQAAVRAVHEAGGDIDKLRDAGLLM